MELKNEERSKRNFIKVALSATVALAAGMFFSKKSVFTQAPEKIKLLTADGKLIEVEKSKIISLCSTNKVSEKEIKNWMQTDKTKKQL